MVNVIQNQDDLQQQATQIIEKLNLKELFSKYGKFILEGSAKYGLMTWRDIDVSLVTVDNPSDDEFWDITRTMFSSKGVNLLTLSDNRSQLEANRPKSMYLGIKYEDENYNIWKIDIRFLAQKHVDPKGRSKMIAEKITDETRRIILEIKSQVDNMPKYRKEYSGVDVYEAVLLNDVRNINQFKNYLIKQGKEL